MSGCVDAVCTRLCPWAAGTTDELGELRREPGARVSRAMCQGEGWLAWPEEADWSGVWTGTSHLGLRGAMGSRSVCSWVLCLCFSVTGCLDLCVQMYVSTFTSACTHMEMFARPCVAMSTATCGHLCPCPCSIAATIMWPHTSASCVLPMFVFVSEFGLVPKRFQGVRLGL